MGCSFKMIKICILFFFGKKKKDLCSFLLKKASKCPLYHLYLKTQNNNFYIKLVQKKKITLNMLICTLSFDNYP